MFQAPAPRALVVDDEGLVSILIEDILIARGFQVTVVNSRAQLPEALRLDCWALAVTDTDLATFADVQTWRVERVILCSGKPRDYIEREFRHFPLIAKPFSEEDFDAELQRLGLLATP